MLIHATTRVYAQRLMLSEGHHTKKIVHTIWFHLYEILEIVN